jgi:cell division protein FtsB
MIKYLKFRYTSIIIAIAILTLNPTAIKIYSSYKEKYNLLSKIVVIKQENEKYKKSLYYLETKNSYLERMVKSELDVIANGEIEYRFIKS